MNRARSRRRVIQKVTFRRKPIGPFTVRSKLSTQHLKRKMPTRISQPLKARFGRAPIPLRPFIRVAQQPQRRPFQSFPQRTHQRIQDQTVQPSTQRVTNISTPQQTFQFIADSFTNTMPILNPTQSTHQTILPPPVLFVTLQDPSSPILSSHTFPQTDRNLSLQIPTSYDDISSNKIPPPIPRNIDIHSELGVGTLLKPHPSNSKSYLGYDIHAYTHQISILVKSMPSDLFNVIVSDIEFQNTIDEMTQKYGDKPAFSNFRSVFHNNTIVDPEIPNINIALVLIRVWNKIKELNEPSTYNHFNETLDQIGHTCIQGVSHRLLMDYCVLMNF